MKRFFFYVCQIVLVVPLLSGATELIYRNTGHVKSPEEISPRDALNFVNEAGATIDIFTPQPFDMSNTQNYTNKGSISSMNGWIFDNAPSGTGVRKWSANFHNDNLGSITAEDGPTLIVLGASGNVVQSSPSKLLVKATNIIDSGIMSVGSQGLMTFDGKNVNLNRARLQVLPLFGVGTAETLPPTNFIPDTAIYDNYWAVGTNNFNSANIILGFQGSDPIVQSPVHNVTAPFGLNGQVILGPMQTHAWVYENEGTLAQIAITNSQGLLDFVLVSTNMTVQGVFVSLEDPEINSEARFFDSSSSSNLFKTIVVKLSSTVTNPVTLAVDELDLFVLDRLASETNRNLNLNLTTAPFTYRPASYVISRTDPMGPGAFDSGIFSNAAPSQNMFFDRNRGMSNSFVSAPYAAYSATADFLSGRAPAVIGSSISNIPGRIEIRADNLDMSGARVRLDSLLNVQAKHLISSSNAIVDTFNVSYDLGSSNGQMRIKDFAQRRVTRFGGTVECWSAVWTNTAILLITNNYGFVVDTNTMTTNLAPVPLTNTLTIGMHAFIMDARSLSRSVPVQTLNLITRSTNVVINDPFLVTNTFLTEATSFTIDGSNADITFGPTLPNWRNNNGPNLINFTNNGTFSVPNEAHFGDDRPLAYSNWVNTGEARGFAAGLTIRSDSVENHGTIQAGSILSVQARSVALVGGSSTLGGDLELLAGTVNLGNYVNNSGGALNFVVTNVLSDNGPAAPVNLSCANGFQVAIASGTGTTGRPQSGDLLGTTITTVIQPLIRVTHTWPGNDRGASPSGFTNNLALGRLIISGGFESEAAFSGTSTDGSTNALYVDDLELVGSITNRDSFGNFTKLKISPNIIIYFAQANMNGVSVAEKMDGKNDGRLRWVPDYVGPNSGTNFVINGVVNRVNSAVLQSFVIDSDGDGIPNALDSMPLFQPSQVDLKVSVVNNPGPMTALSWMTVPNSWNYVYYQTNVSSANWQLLTNFISPVSYPSSPARVTILDPVNGSPRYYRVVVEPSMTFPY